MAAAGPGAPPAVGVLLVNTGTPASPTTADVRRYLRQFLNDPRVIDLPAAARWLLVEVVILPFRPAKSARAYRSIWTPRGSPLLTHCSDLAAGLEAELGAGYRVRLAMQFGQPAIGAALDAFAADGVFSIVCAPLFPHYAAASYGSAAAAVYTQAAARWVVPALKVVPPFFAEPAFIDAIAARARAVVDAWAPDHVVLSYHGVPERHCRKADPSGAHCLASAACCDTLGSANAHCYRAQCVQTSRLIAARLGLDPTATTTAFQSRLGRTPWIGPHTEEVLDGLARARAKRVLVIAPSFVADCLETIEEIGIRARERFAESGGELRLLPALNADPDWCRALAALVRAAAGPTGG